jgi:hypothetical protein
MKEVTLEVERDVFWDNWGRIVKVFNKGDIVDGTAFYNDDGVIESIWAESTLYEGINDDLPLDAIKII